ncbi:restriction endonuclease [Dehalogenimonas etheniformans]|uniref:Restriction endonuclease n=1 Tax=Dehalogenimonas etheniformans TaxID=1536648 RepID=A0A2P5P727_9CHLR|nr:restriction endonuclease [Dehalogenimonas etheniformans]PPD58094.1 restriction endonuclease [Dehalogenimonas etheniformans]QNT75495.1 restriction endonuclease [Dehalogenimonas etheniformans]
MPIPDYQTIMLPLLTLISDGKEHTLQDSIASLGNQFHLMPEDLRKVLPSGRQAVFHNRVGWARTYMKKAGLIESTKRGSFKITNRGKEVLKAKPNSINAKYLEQFKEFQDFKKLGHEKPKTPKPPDKTTAVTPQEALENAYNELNSALADELLQKIKDSDPGFFENTVIELLVQMGYGGSIKDAGQVVGKSGDEGIDGTIKEDKLGLDVIYIQAKRWEGTVSRPEVQKFAGALQGQRAKKGIFITTSGFSDEAERYAQQIESKIVLIDGAKLTELMIEHNIGVSPVVSYNLKRLDSDYFSE